MSGLDDPEDSGVGARAPLLSTLRPRADRPEWDTAVWLNVLTLPGTPDAEAFYRELERFLLDTYDGGYALTGVEWSKGWGVHGRGGLERRERPGHGRARVLRRRARRGAVGLGRGGGHLLDRLDPHRVYGNAFLSRLFS